ncbi:MAG TPA: ATP-binding protein [Thermoanaerobaculia bacterium]|nr:ATP-binding protein [Thermoanaerobaculia bacterium]
MSINLRRRFLREEDGPPRQPEPERALLWMERLFASNVIGIFRAGPDARITAANEAFLSMTGRGREELARGELSWIELTAPGWEEADARAMVELMTSGVCAPYEKEYRRGDGTRVPILTGAALQPESQEAVGFALDLTERKRAENRAALLAEAGSVLSESLDHEETLQSLVHLAVPRLADYGLIFELQDGPRLRQVALRHVDPAKEDALRHLGQVFQDSPANPASYLWRVVQTGQSELLSEADSETARDITQDPRLLEGFLRLRARSFLFVPLVARGEVLGVLQLSTSESGRVFGPEDLELAEGLASRASLAIDNARLYGRAEAASKAKDHFLAALSHELRTPLTPVLMKVSALAQSPDLPEPVRADLRMVQRNVELEAKLIDDLLDLTRVSRGKLILHFEVTDVHALLEHVVAICSEDVGSRKLQIALEPGASEHHVWADSARLQQVYWNLVKNAVKFTPEGGTIRVRTGNPEPGRIEVSVIDPGIGIEPDELPRLFNAFEQGSGTIPRTFGGLGLGLAICKALVDQHGGGLSGLSAGRGKGATFTVTLATVTPHQAAEPAGAGLAEAASPSQSPSLSQSLRLLLVEDNEPTLEVMTTLLELAGHDVKPAPDLRTARQLAESHEFDLVVSDLGLPDGTGFDLMRELRDRYGLKGIAVSGFGMEEDLRRSRESGFLEHLVKPVDVDKLRAALARAALGKH